MPTATEMIVPYWPVAAVAVVLVLALLLPVRSFIRRSATATQAPAAAPLPPQPPTPVQRLAASLDQAARERAQIAKVSAKVVAVPPPPRSSAWNARAESAPPLALAPAIPVPAPAKAGQAQTPPNSREHRAFGRPPGLSAPRPEGRDDLKAIHGIGPRIERGLNALGVFHYDQIAAWDRRTVVWVETWFSLRGTIVREHWVEQARQLMPQTRPHRSVRG